ncbi:hypothetical protein D3C87_226940 [compost metagenome]
MEGTTDAVCLWLDYYRFPFIRLNGEDYFKLKKLGDLPQDEQIGLVWYRRKLGRTPAHYTLKKDSFEVRYVMRRFLIDEFNTLHSLLFYSIDKKKWLNDPIIEDHLNKLNVLFLAKKLQLNIPYSEVLTDKQSLMEMLQQYPHLIVKPLNECVLLEDADQTYYRMLTKSINEKDIKSIPDTFFPSLVQERINKKFEVRVFYLAGTFYSMAIFSQSNKKTVADFRNYDNKRPNRNVPYKLPNEIESKLKRLMKELNFETGSIDLMVDMEGNYIFLEINPAGQFGMVSYPCNYYLEKKMAQLFIQTSTKNEKKIHQ